MVFPLEEGVPDIHNALQVVKTANDGSEKNCYFGNSCRIRGWCSSVQSPWNLQMVLQRGMKVVDLGRTISVPVGP